MRNRIFIPPRDRGLWVDEILAITGRLAVDCVAALLTSFATVCIVAAIISWVAK